MVNTCCDGGRGCRVRQGRFMLTQLHRRGRSEEQHDVWPGAVEPVHRRHQENRQGHRLLDRLQLRPWSRPAAVEVGKGVCELVCNKHALNMQKNMQHPCNNHIKKSMQQTCSKHVAKMQQPSTKMQQTCQNDAANMQQTCSKHALNMQRTCNEHAQNMQQTCNKHAANMQQTRHACRQTVVHTQRTCHACSTRAPLIQHAWWNGCNHGGGGRTSISRMDLVPSNTSSIASAAWPATDRGALPNS